MAPGQVRSEGWQAWGLMQPVLSQLEDWKGARAGPGSSAGEESMHPWQGRKWKLLGFPDVTPPQQRLIGSGLPSPGGASGQSVPICVLQARALSCSGRRGWFTQQAD